MRPIPIRHATTHDGFQIPYVRTGTGVPFVLMPWCFGIINALPAYDAWFQGLAERFDLIRYDGRGRGLAPRMIQHCSREDMQSDLLAVLEATRPGKLILFAGSMEAPAAIDFAVRCPGEILGLILWMPWTGGGTVGSQAIRTMIDQGTRNEQDWKVFLATFATRQHHPRSDSELDTDIAILMANMRQDDWAVINRDFDATPDALPLLPGLTVPTLVICPRGANMSRPSDAVDIASRIPLGRAVLLEGSLIGPAEDQTQPGLDAIDEFVAEFAAPATLPPACPQLSKRESEVLTLVASGHRNHEVASQLGISERTVERHVSNIYAKLEVRGKADAIRWAVRTGLV